MWREADNSIINICTPICWYWESIPKAVFFLKNIQWDRVHRYIHSWPMSGKTTFTGILYITDLWGLKDTLTFMIFASVSKILKLNWNIECWQNQVLLMNSFYLKTYWDISFCQVFQIFSFFFTILISFLSNTRKRSGFLLSKSISMLSWMAKTFKIYSMSWRILEKSHDA